ncbi:MAG: PAS domain-containing protein [Gammaproteobacteria bacterium]|jgi:PAS domain S-box-containing protein
MIVVKESVEFVFSIALFINALLFIPQSIRIVKKKTARGVSLVTFLGLLLIQLTIVLHGIITSDYLLIIGYLVSMLTCGAVVVLVLIYNRKKTVDYELSGFDILNQLPCNIYWKDREGVFLGCNKSNWEDFGFESLADFQGKTDHDVLSEEEADQIRLVDDKVMKSGEHEIVEEHVTSDKGKSTYLSHKVPLKNKHGKIIGVLGVSIDVTEKNRDAFDKLKTLENIIAVMPGNVYWLDKNGVYLGCNDNQAKLIGLASRKDIVGKRNIEIPGFLIPEVLDKYNKQVVETGRSITIEEPATLPDGTNAVFLSSKVPLRNSNNEVIGMIGISFDITDRKKHEEELRKAKEEAEEADRIKTDFISNMEHDIRTPLIGIYGMMDIFAKQETDPEKKPLMNEMTICAKELLDFCDGILDFSKIEADSFPIVSKSFVLQKLVNSVITIESVAARNKKLELSAEFDKQLPKVVISDPYRVKRILINLVSNAVKFTKEGEIKVSVSLDKKDIQNRKVIVKFIIIDTGMGIPDDKKALIYERFTKVIPSNKGLYKGLGLGLRIVKQFVDELDGDVHLKSEIGKGSAFTILLPFKTPLSDEILDEE